MKKKVVLLITLITLFIVTFSGCGWFKSKVNSLQGSLAGVSYTVDFYDNYGARFLTVEGENIDITGNVTEETGFDSDGSTITNYSLSSVITLTIDGNQIQSCGNTVIFADSGLTDLTSVAKVVNKYKNYFGKPLVVVIQSQLGVPICAYSGDEVYWEIPDDLPKMTKLMIDDKALYIHRANFEIIDRDLIE